MEDWTLPIRYQDIKQRGSHEQGGVPCEQGQAQASGSTTLLLKQRSHLLVSVFGGLDCLQ